MIGEAPRIRVDHFERPEPALIEPFRDVQTGFVVDAMGGQGALAHTIKPVCPDQSLLCGIALTCDAGPADNLAVLAALEHVQAGDVIVASAHGHLGCAIVGDLVLGLAKNGGASGFVSDGAVRDTRGIREVGLPCFAAAVSPNSPHKSGPATVGGPIVLGDVVINSGDLIVADEDGVVVVPRSRLTETAARLKEVLIAEAELNARVQAGLSHLSVSS